MIQENIDKNKTYQMAGLEITDQQGIKTFYPMIQKCIDCKQKFTVIFWNVPRCEECQEIHIKRLPKKEIIFPIPRPF